MNKSSVGGRRPARRKGSLAVASVAALIVGLMAPPLLAASGKGGLPSVKARPAPEAGVPEAGGAGGIAPDDGNGLRELAADDDTRKLQLALIWAGHSARIADGVMDEATRGAVRAFQRAIGERATGELTEDQKIELLRQGMTARAEAGWTSYINQDLGYRVGYPGILLTRARATEGGSRVLASDDGARRLEIEVIDPMSDREFEAFFQSVRGLDDGQKTITRIERGARGFLFEGREGRQHFIGRVERRARAIVGFTYFHPAGSDGVIVPAIASEFEVPDVLGPPEPPPPDTEVGLYEKNDARVGETPDRGEDGAGPDVAEPAPARPPAPAPSRPRPPATADARDLVPLPSLPMAVETQPLDPAGLFQKVKDSVWVVVASPMRGDLPYLEDGFSQGSAVAVSDQHLFTNCHVLEDQQFFGIFRNEDMSDLRPVTVKLMDEDGDRCIIRVDKPDLPAHVAIRSHADVVIGERAYTVGAPSGLDLTLGEGLVSSKRRHKGQQYVQTSAPISPGSSGGGLFDNRGNLLGITTFMLRDTQALNFAIAAEEFLRDAGQ
ncbi:serine protease [Zavarzinia compransoris]|uniref:trypsin-like peptidase domain-containing protein n=1 Tax=Zavarzinia marina TaxID=2911065 RepID=UPI001F41C694|nr:trypsin-like peptidase domain-containing protein [Zavarzinia marina]MCF4167233.1 serine protease [Zavarzinia marina]